MSRKQQAREALRDNWDGLLTESLPVALKVAQEEAAARAVVASIWPALCPDDMVLLDRGDPSLLRGPSIPNGLGTSLSEELANRAEPRLKEVCPDNPYARHPCLHRLVRDEVEARCVGIRDATHQLFEAGQAESFGSPSAVRDRVLVLLSDLVLDELPRLSGTDEAEAKRKLKTLTALATPGGGPAEREARLRRLRDGSTASFPFVVKYLNRNVLPSFPSFPAGLAITLSGFRPELVVRFPEARHVGVCLERYQRREGVICRFIDPDGPIAPTLEAQFASTPAFTERPASGLWIPRSVGLAEGRRDRLRQPDGVVCAIGLGVLLESVLRQACSAMHLGGGLNARGWDLFIRLRKEVGLQDQTAALLEVVFHHQSLNLRDAMAHGAFFAGDPDRLDAVLAGLSRTLDLLVEDLVLAGVASTVFDAPRWDNGRVLEEGIRTTLIEQYQPDRNLIRSLIPSMAWVNTLKVLASLIPDKHAMGQAGFLLWVSGQEDAKLGRSDDAHHFAAIFAGLVVLEELFRAVYEVHNRPVLCVREDGADRVRCELSILDDRPGQLLDPVSLRSVFHELYAEESFQRGLTAVKAIRDAALHGAWEALRDPWHLYSHLVMKMVFTLGETVGVR